MRYARASRAAVRLPRPSRPTSPQPAPSERRGPTRIARDEQSLLQVPGVDIIVVYRNVDRVGEEFGITSEPCRMIGKSLLVEDRRPWSILEHIIENGSP